MKPIDELIAIFRELLSTMWGRMITLVGDDSDSLLDDWKQANWELIVESSIQSDTPVCLQPYGNGADFHGSSSRILRPEVLPTHAVHCMCSLSLKDRVTGDEVLLPDAGLPFERLVTMQKGWYYEEAPFDCVLLEQDEKQLVVGLDEVSFVLEEVASVT